MIPDNQFISFFIHIIIFIIILNIFLLYALILLYFYKSSNYQNQLNKNNEKIYKNKLNIK